MVAGFGKIGEPDRIDLADSAFGAAGKKGPPSYNANLLGGTPTVTEGTHTANIALLGPYTASEFAVSNDGHGSSPHHLHVSDVGDWRPRSRRRDRITGYLLNVDRVYKREAVDCVVDGKGVRAVFRSLGYPDSEFDAFCCGA